MKSLFFYLVIFSLFGLTFCSTESADRGNAQEGKSKHQIRKNTKNVKIVQEFFLTKDDTIQGILTEEKKFDREGRLISCTKMNPEHTELYNYTYDEAGNIIEMYWEQTGKTSKKIEYSYDGERIDEERVFLDGEFAYSDKYSYEFDENNRVVEKKVTRSFLDDNIEDLAFHIYKYNEDHSIKEERKLRKDDASCCELQLIYQYDEFGNIKELKEFVNEDFSVMCRYNYNEFGEKVEDSIYIAEEGYWKRLTYRLDEYGTAIRKHFYNTYDNSYGYRFQVEYY